MAGSIFWKERSAVTLSNANYGSVTDKTATAAGTDLDVRTAGNAADDYACVIELSAASWGTVTGISAGVVLFEVYAVPKMDGTNAVDVDTTSGASYISPSHRVGSFIAHKSLVASTAYRFATAPFLLFPNLYTIYLKNTSGQTMSATTATIKAFTAQDQYT
jgi:hypothetical protein